MQPQTRLASQLAMAPHQLTLLSKKAEVDGANTPSVAQHLAFFISRSAFEAGHNCVLLLL